MTGRVYDTRRWQRVRANQLRREPLCRLCITEGQATPRPAQHVDHITPISAGGSPFDPSNLQSLCPPHHSSKTAQDKQGIAFDDWELRGCYPDGSPRDPRHPWYSGPPRFDA